MAASQPDQEGMSVNASLEFTESCVHIIVLFVEFVGLGNVGLESDLKLERDLSLWTREPLLRGYSTVDLLVLTTLCQLFLILQTLFTYFTKQPTLKRRSSVLSLPLQLVFPVSVNRMHFSSPNSNPGTEYDWPPWTDCFILTAFDIANIFFLQNNQL